MKLPFRGSNAPAVKETLQVDKTMGDPRVVPLQRCMETGDWVGVCAILAEETDPDGLAFLIDIAAEVAGSEIWLPDLIAEADDDDVRSTLMYGARAIHWAWDVRTRYPASYVTDDRWWHFGQRIAIAEDCLSDVIKREPGNVSARYLRLTTSRARQLGVQETRRRFVEVIALCPGHLQAHVAMLQQLYPRWSGGSYEPMHTFAMDSVLSADKTSPLVRLIAQAHIEHWFELDEDATEYMSSMRVGESLRFVASRLPGSPPTRDWWTTYNLLALAFFLNGDRAASRQIFDALGDRVTPYPWEYLEGSDPAENFCRIRAAVRRR